jgi:hypothetical protein
LKTLHEFSDYSSSATTPLHRTSIEQLHLRLPVPSDFFD